MSESVKDYFDKLAKRWDSFGNPREEFIHHILSLAQIGPTSTVLDLACGTGILTPYLLDTGVSSIVGIDISPKMIEIAKRKWKDSRVRFETQDFYSASGLYSHIVCYNAFPHFLDKESFVQKCKELLQIGGILLIAHDSGRAVLNAHHDAHAKGVSRHLEPVEDEMAMFDDGFEPLCSYDKPDAYCFLLRRK